MQIECHIFAFQKISSVHIPLSLDSHINMHIDTLTKCSLQVLASPAVYEVLSRLDNQLGMHISEYPGDLPEPWALKNSL